MGYLKARKKWEVQRKYCSEAMRRWTVISNRWVARFIPVAPWIHTVPPVSVLFPQFIYGYNQVHNICLLLRNCSINGADATTIGMSRSTKSADVKKGPHILKNSWRGGAAKASVTDVCVCVGGGGSSVTLSELRINRTRNEFHLETWLK